MSDIDDRYVKVETKQLSNGKLVYKSLRPRTINVDSTTDLAITADNTIRADVLAYNVYGSPEKWWKIVIANSKFAGSLFFTPGQQIFIPK